MVCTLFLKGSELERVYLEDVEIKPLKMSPGCKEGQTMSDERSCAKYSECVALPDGNTTTLIKECTYPFLFDVQTGKCEHFKDVKCQPGQIIPKSPCKYSIVFLTVDESFTEEAK